jgi:4'-phosphopantetheinyl transferase
MSSAWNEILTSAHAWYINPEQISPATLPLNWLDATEHSHLRKIPRKNLQHIFLATRILCRATLSHYAEIHPADWRFKTTTHGKPKIFAPRGYSSLRFNLTHSDSLIICLITRAGEVGVDAEEISRRVNIDEVIRHFFAPSEQAELTVLTPTKRIKRFFEIWVLKEAYLKGRGRGLTISPERVPIQFDAKHKLRPIRGWQLALHHPTPNHVVATAIRANEPIKIVWKNAAGLFKT